MQEEIEKAKIVAFRLLSYRMRSCREISDKLKEKGFSKNAIHSVIQDLIKINYLNDSQFAKAFIENRLAHNPKGKKLLRYELTRKGVEKTILDKAISETISTEKEENVARFLAKKIWQRKKNVEENKRKAQTYNYLARRGFLPSLITKILGEISRQVI